MLNLSLCVVFLTNILLCTLPACWAGAVEQNNQGKKSSLAFMGVIEPETRFRVILNHGEGVKVIHCSLGEKIESGQLVAELTNDTLSATRFELLQKKNLIDSKKQEQELVDLEIKIKNQQLEVLNNEIKKEKRLASQVDGYLLTAVKALNREKLQLTGQLELLSAKRKSILTQKEQMDALAKIIDQQLSDLKRRQNLLMVTAPFSGEMVFVSPDGERTPPGGIVCELWSDDAYRVRGKIVQNQINYIAVGDEVQVFLDFSDEKPLKGKVVSVRQAMEKVNKGYPSFDVLIHIPSKAKWLRPGMMVSIKKMLSEQ